MFYSSNIIQSETKSNEESRLIFLFINKNSMIIIKVNKFISFLLIDKLGIQINRNSHENI